MKSLACLVFISLISFTAYSQVDQIKSASASHHSSGNSSGGYSGDGAAGSGFLTNFLFNIVFNQVIQAQQQKLQHRHEVPTMVSLDVMAQVAAQPSAYYIVQPRIRANWGLFSTDFRMNYLIEEGLHGATHIRTKDWQILQLNVITTRDINARVGGGVIQEAFGDRNGFPEWTAGFNYQPHSSRVGAMAEYRGSEPRKEVNACAQYRLFDNHAMHGFATAGLVYQRYYQSITTWGMQCGFLLRVY
jgi:hypothetical protein